MSRITVTIAEDLLANARAVLGTKTHADTIRTALREAIRRQQLRDALTHRGKIKLHASQDDLQRLRAEGDSGRHLR